MQLARAPCGLSRAGPNGCADPVPLEHIAVDAHIVGFVARTRIAQTFRNREHQPFEAVYTFPLDEGAAVCAFEASIDGYVCLTKFIFAEWCTCQLL